MTAEEDLWAIPEYLLEIAHTFVQLSALLFGISCGSSKAAATA